MWEQKDGSLPIYMQSTHRRNIPGGKLKWKKCHHLGMEWTPQTPMLKPWPTVNGAIWGDSKQAYVQEVVTVSVRVISGTQALPHFLLLVHSENRFFLYIFLPP